MRRAPVFCPRLPARGRAAHLARIACSLLAFVAAAILVASASAQTGYDAMFVSQTVPSFIEIQTPTSVSITMRNTGTATWRAAEGDVFLSTQEPQDNFYWCIQDNRYGGVSGNRVLLPHDVAPGQTVRFEFVVKPLGCVFAATAPFRFRMLSQRFGTFGEMTPDPGIVISKGAVYVAQRVPAKAPSDAPIQVSVTYRNTTGVAWGATAGYSLRPAFAGGDVIWDVAQVPLPATVPPGEAVTFEFEVVTPVLPGTYRFEWQMHAPDGTAFGDRSAAAQVNVVAVSAVNYGGLWWASPAGSESGWGVNFAHQGDVMFVSWFTYDASGRGWWLVSTALRTTGSVYEGTLFKATGPPFFSIPFNRNQVRTTAVGRVAITFADADNASFSTTVNGTTQVKPITRQVFGPLPTCTFNLLQDPAAAYNFQDLWWAAPAGSESGWGINLTQQGQTIFATWYTYDADGSPLWLVVTAPRVEADVYRGDLYRTTGPPFDAFRFDPARVVATKVGSATFTFRSGNDATFAYTVGNVTQSKALVREILTSPGTVCQ